MFKDGSKETHKVQDILFHPNIKSLKLYPMGHLNQISFSSISSSLLPNNSESETYEKVILTSKISSDFPEKSFSQPPRTYRQCNVPVRSTSVSHAQQKGVLQNIKRSESIYLTKQQYSSLT